MSGRAIGSLRHSVRLEEPRRIELSGGAANIAWQRIAVLFAAIETTSGKEIEIADGMTGLVSHKIILRHRPGVTPQMRFVSGSRLFEIRAVLDRDGRRRWLECLCGEHLP